MQITQADLLQEKDRASKYMLKYRIALAFCKYLNSVAYCDSSFAYNSDIKKEIEDRFKLAWAQYKKFYDRKSDISVYEFRTKLKELIGEE